jgi:LacI family transcriptional regulator
MAVGRKDVAALAGVSPAVVSYVLNGGPRKVAPQTRRRVLDAVDRLGYRPNVIARSLRMNKTMTIGLVVPDTSNPFFAELSRAVEDAAFADGYTVLLGNAQDDAARQRSYLRTFEQRQVDGVLLVPTTTAPGQFEEIVQSGVPLVVMDRKVPDDAGVSQVLVDNVNGARRATNHLLGHGKRRIACIAGPANEYPSHDRLEGWRAALAENGTPPDPGLVITAEFGKRAGYEAASQLIDATDVDAIFVTSDEQSIGVMYALHQRGIACPDDISVVSFDGVATMSYIAPSVTTMAQPFDELGRAAISEICAKIANPDREPSTTTLPPTLRRRRSCGCEPDSALHQRSYS